MKKVSIIIPVYNCAEYLCECLNSVINQTFGIENIEVIIINDGSTDDSSNIINSYLNRYNDWIFINQENKGLSASRNRGLDICSCEYIMFLDSDDYLDEKMVEILYKKINENKKIMMSVGKLQAFDKNGFIKFYTDKILSENMISSYSQYNKIIDNVVAYAKLYRKNFINNLRFIEGVKHEDVYFSSYLILQNKLFIISCDAIYYRRIRNGENKSITQNLTLETFGDLIINYNKLLEDISDKYSLYLLAIKKLNKYLYSKIPVYDWNKGEIKIDEFINLNVKNKIGNIIAKIYNFILSIGCRIYILKFKKKV